MQLDTIAVFAQRLAPIILLMYSLAICAELTVDRLCRRNIYKMEDTLQNLGMFFINRMTGAMSGLYMLSVLATFQHLVPWKLNGPTYFVATFLIVDMLFYVQHYWLHRNPILAAFHEVHHSSQHYNFTTTLRANFFLPLINPFFYAPAALLGCDALSIIVAFSLIQVYQFFLHTQFVPKLSFLEGVLNTPSAHRVHHGVEPSQYHSNLGGVFLIWDKLFGSYASEEKPVVYGVIGVEQESFISAQIRPFVNLYKNWLQKQRAHRYP